MPAEQRRIGAAAGRRIVLVPPKTADAMALRFTSPSCCWLALATATRPGLPPAAASVAHRAKAVV